MALDLLAPPSRIDALRENYVHQLRQTIDAYLPSYIFIGEALQNALDAIRMNNTSTKQITIDLDFDSRSVRVRDTGIGFPDKPELLFLGGGGKKGLKLAGMVGVGLKVVLFSSIKFQLRARNSTKGLSVNVDEAYRFDSPSPPVVELPAADCLPVDEEDYFSAGTGTEIFYSFPPDTDTSDSIPRRYLRDVFDECITDTTPNYETSLTDAIDRGGYPNRLAALLASDLRRYSYLGATQEYDGLQGLKVVINVTANEEGLGEFWAYADGQPQFTFEVSGSYLTVRDSLNWAKTPKPVIRSDELGEGGENLTRQAMAFNVTKYSTPEQYTSLLINARGRVSPEVERFQKLLYPKLKSVTLTIGRIPHFNTYLPGAARRIISARGVVTQHDLDVWSGRNQQYVRCFDVVVDVDADLNYGKTHLKDTHLVSNVRRFINEAFKSSISNAARNLVGKVRDDEDAETSFWSRPDLGVAALSEKKVPCDENDVIALFHELIGRGHFEWYVSYGLSSKDTYDGRAILLEGAPDKVAHLKSDPIDTDLSVIEFKMRGASIARDFDRDEKAPDKVDLVICYEVGTSTIDTYQTVELDDSDLYKTGKITYQHVTHVLLDTRTGREVQMLPLKPFIEQHYPPDKPADIPSDVVDTD